MSGAEVTLLAAVAARNLATYWPPWLGAATYLSWRRSTWGRQSASARRPALVPST